MKEEQGEKILVLGTAPQKDVIECVEDFSATNHVVSLLVKQREQVAFEHSEANTFYFNGTLSLIYHIFFLIVTLRPDQEIIVCGDSFFHTNITRYVKLANFLCANQAKILTLVKKNYAPLAPSLPLFISGALIPLGAALCLDIIFTDFFILSALCLAEISLHFMLPALAVRKPWWAKLNKVKKNLFPTSAQIHGFFLQGHPFLQYVGNPEKAFFNRHGFYGPEIPRTKGKTEKRIVCLGDSTSEGNHQWPAFLKTMLGETAGDFAVYNCSVGGHSSAHSLIALCLKIMDYQPDLIIVHQMINDAIAATFPDFKTDYSHRYKAWSFELQADAATLRDFEILVLRHSYLAFLLSHLVPRYRRIYQAQGIWPRITHFYEKVPDAALPGPPPADLENGRFAFLRNLDNMATIAMKHGARVLFSTVPVKKGVSRYPFAQYNDYIREFCKGRGELFFCDVDANFDQIKNKKDLFVDDFHVLDAGNEHKAAMMRELILNEIFPA